MSDDDFLTSCLFGLLFRLLFSKWFWIFVLAVFVINWFINAINDVSASEIYQQIIGFFEDLELPELPEPASCEFSREPSGSGYLTIGGQAIVQNTDLGLACRSCPGKQDSPPEFLLTNGQIVIVRDGPVSVSQDNWLWWEVETEATLTCWAAEENWLTIVEAPDDGTNQCNLVYSNEETSSLTIGDQAMVQNTQGNGLACRSCPGDQENFNNLEVWLQDDTKVIVNDGPVIVPEDNNGWLWWKLWTESPTYSGLCWAAEVVWLAPVEELEEPEIPLENTICFRGSDLDGRVGEDGEFHNFVVFEMETEISHSDLVNKYNWSITEHPERIESSWWGFNPDEEYIGEAGFEWLWRLPRIGINANDFEACGTLK